MSGIAGAAEEIVFLHGAYADKMAASCNLVKAYKQGNTIVRVFDGAYASKTSEEIQKAKERLSHTCWKCVEAARAGGKYI